MSRASDGTYSLPAGNPVVAQTTIASTWANGTLTDIASTLTASLDRDGKGPMRAALELVDGSVAAPGVSFDSETGTGLYRAGASDVRLAVSGSDRLQATGAGIDISGKMAATGAVSGTTGTFSDAVSGTTLTGSGAISGASLATTGSVAVTLPAAPGSTLPMHLSAAGAITAAQVGATGIADLAVETGKIAANAVTRAKLAAVGQVASASTSNFSTASATFVDVTNATLEITTTGRPVAVFLQPDGTASGASVGAVAAPGTVAAADFQVLRGASVVGVWSISSNPAGAASNAAVVPVGCILALDAPGAGTYTYKLQAKTAHGDTDGAQVYYAKLVAYEL